MQFTVYGVAQPKGNMRPYVPRGMKFPIITDSNRNCKAWQQLVAEGASHALQDLPEAERSLLIGAVRVTLAFYLPRPKKYNRRGVYVEHLTAPDIDKLARAILDALSKVIWQDDSQVVCLEAIKRYAPVDGAPHVDVWVTPCSSVQLKPRDVPLFELLHAT